MTDALRIFDGKRRRFRRAYESPDGRAVLEDILEYCDFGKSPRSFNSASGAHDPLALAVAAGKARVAEYIMKHLLVSDMEMATRLKTAKTRQEHSYDD